MIIIALSCVLSVRLLPICTLYMIVSSLLTEPTTTHNLQATTIRIGSDAQGHEVHVPFKSVVPLVDPNDLVIGGWDINDMNLADACERAQVCLGDVVC